MTKGSAFCAPAILPALADGKRYLNYDAGIQAELLKDPAGFIKSADAKFPALLKK